MRSDWKKVRLGEVLGKEGYIRGPFGSALKRGELLSEGPIPVYEQQHAIYGVRDFRFYIDKNKYMKMKRFAVQVDDIIVSCSGTIGKASTIKTNDPIGIISQALLILRADKKIIFPDYLAKFIQSREGFNAITSRSSGSVQVNIAKREIIENIPLLLPSLPEQCAIATTLSCLDDKIELNNKINANMEAQAQSLYRSWFVNFEPFRGREFADSKLGPIPKGWRVGPLNELADIIMGQSPDGTSYNEEGIGTVFYQGRAEFNWRFPTTRLYTTEPKRMAKENDILISVRAPVGDINIAKEDCCVGRGLAAVRSKHNAQSFIFYLLKQLRSVLDAYNGEGTVFGSINQKAFNDLTVLIPPDNLIHEYDKLVSVSDKQINVLSKENDTLTVLRDTLLPKLMNGEVEIPLEGNCNG